MEIVNKLTTRKGKKPRWWILIVSIIVCFIAAWPFYQLITLSLRDITDFESRLRFPKILVWENYVTLLKGSEIWIGFKNSVIYSGLTVLIEITCASMAGYSLSRGSKNTTKAIRTIQMMIIMVPGIITLVGTYSLMIKFNLTNNLTALAFLTAAAGIPSCSFIYMNFINSIPVSLDEAARIDGAGVGVTFFKIIMPQLLPITITRAIMIGIGAWNNYLMPLYLLNDSRKKTIILTIRSAFSMTGGDRNLAMACATCTVGILPVIVVYMLLQRKIIESQIGASIKG